jgi:CHAT domain-containing protein
MFLCKKNAALIIIFFLSLLYSCNSNQTISIDNTIDTAKINYWKKSFDTLYDEYWTTRESSLIRKAVIFGDSLRRFENSLLNDTGYRQPYIKFLFNYSVCLNDLKNFIKSRELFDRCAFLYKEYNLKKPSPLAYGQQAIGDIYSRYGDYKKAILFYNQPLKYYITLKDQEKTASCLLNLSIALKELHLFNEAADSLQQIFRLNAIGPKRKASAFIELADIYVRQHKIPEAGLQLQKAKQLLNGTPDAMEITGIYATLFTIEGNFYMAGNDPKNALAAYHQSIDSAIKTSAQNLRDREIGKIDIAIGKALEKLNYKDSALQYYNKALYTVIDNDTSNIFSLPQQKDIYAENTIAEALYARADCIISRGMNNTNELENAVACYQLAFATESKLLNAFSYDDSRLFMLEETRKQTEKAIGICYSLYKKTNTTRWANEAFLFAEHNKAFVLQESIRRNTAAGLFLKHDTLFSKMLALQNNLALTTIELSKQNLPGVKDTALLLSLNTAKQKNEEALLAAENDLRIKNPQYTNWLNEETSLPADELIDKTIATGTGMIEYFSGDSSLYAFSASKNKALNFYKLADTVKNLAVDFLQFFSRQDLILNKPAEYANAAYQLYRSLLGPYLPNGNTATLIIPDGFIAYIPFDALLTNSTASTNISSFPFLIKQQQTYYAPSCKTLLAQSQNKNGAAGNSIAAFAPVFANRERNLSTLTHSNGELEAIKQFYPGGKFFTGSNAGFKQFEDNCSNSAILHLATHASPGNDSLPPRIELFDSSVYLNLIYAKKINAKLVVLSGCETGKGILNNSEGLMSLARGFSYAGTKNVIASLWQTEDNSSAKIFKDFYSNLSNNNFSSALYHSKLVLLNSGTVATASPYYWAGYIYIGSPEEGLTVQPGNKLKWIAFMASFVMITAYFLFIRRRRQASIR